MLAVHGNHNVFDKRCAGNGFGCAVFRICPALWDHHPRHAGQSRIHSPIVEIHDLLTAFLEIAVVVAPFHLYYSHLNRDHLGQLEKCGLQDCINTIAQAQFMGNPGGVHNIELRMFVV